MNVQDFVFNKDNLGNEYVTFAEGVTKTRQGGTRKKGRLIKPKMFATGGENCPVALFRSYLLKRPAELRNTGPIYLGILNNHSES